MSSLLSSVSARFGRLRRATLLAGAIVLGLPAGAIGLQLGGWFGQWTGGSALMMSGESIGSLPCYFTPGDTAALPGATPEQLALQVLPALRADVASGIVFDVVAAATGNGYAFVSPSPSNEFNANLRVFGDLSASLDPKVFAVRTNTLSWRVGPAFAGASLSVASSGKTTTTILGPTATDVPLPIDSPMWAAMLASGPIGLALTRTDGLVATLQLSLVGGQLAVVQNVP
jgi:hypothetical protein